MSDALDGIVVGTLDVGEADRIVRLLTASLGRHSVLALRARASKKRFGGLLDPGTQLRLQRGRRRSGLEVVQSADRISGPDVARTDLMRITLVAYGCELCAGLAPEATPAPKLYRLLQVWLELLEGETPPTEASRLALEAKALTFAGLTPALVRCAVCSEDLDDPAVFDPEAGGALHARCGGGGHILAATAIELEALRRTPLADTPHHQVTSSSPWVLSDFVQHHLGRGLNSRGMLETLSG
ncbi:MAG: DNA repair protein RecO [Myxococcales bacterium]|nr:DNA repair protein RecO [Myxococcales bacterium]